MRCFLGKKLSHYLKDKAISKSAENLRTFRLTETEQNFKLPLILPRTKDAPSKATNYNSVLSRDEQPQDLKVFLKIQELND